MASPRTVAPWLAGGGELGALMRSMDWSANGLGPVESWPQSLRSAVGICLGSRFPIVMYWGSGCVVLYNDAYAEILGKKHPWALGRECREVWSEIWDVIAPMLDGVMTRGEATWSDDQLLLLERRGYPEECYFSFSFSPVRGAAGVVDGIFTAVIETTRRVVGERRLRTLRDLAARAAAAKDEEHSWKSALEVLEGNRQDIPFALLYRADAAGRSAHLVGAAGALAGDAPLLIDLTAPEGLWPGDRPAAAVLPVSRPGVPAYGYLIAGLSAGGELTEKYRGFLDLVAEHVATGIANARAYEEERKRAEALAEIDRAKTAFFSNVSHELRTPLTLMLGPLEDILAVPSEREAPENRALLALVHRNGLRLQKLVNTLLDFSRIEAGRARAAYVPTDLAALTADLASVFRSAVERAGLRMRVDCAPLAEPAYVDREMWEKIVLNLLSNALKFTFEGEIAVVLRPVEDRIELSVSDTGTGIAASELPHLFERFRRVEGARSRTHEGTGIGLALVQELARLHGGAVRVESADGRGSTFTVVIPGGREHLPADRIGDAPTLEATPGGTAPYVQEALSWLSGAGTPSEALLPEPAASQDAPSAPGGRRERILWADDNADLREYVRRLLAGRYAVEAVADGEAAWAAVKARRPDLVLADVMMPGLDGFGLLARLRSDEQTKTLPVILLSARAGEESRIEGLAAGADDYLMKPFSAKELLARVEARLAREQAALALRESEERFRHMADNAPVMIRVTEPDGTCTYLSRSWYEFTGQTPETGLGFGWLQAVHPDDRRQSEEAFVAANARREPFRLEYRLRRRNGEYGWAIDSGAPRLGPAGEFLGYIGSVLEITERKRMEEELRDADRRKNDFIAMLAHELRSPLGAIVLAADLLEHVGVADERARRALQSIVRQNANLKRLVDDLLDVARASHGKLQLERRPVDVLGAARDVVASHPPGQAHIDVSGETAWVLADPARLQQMIGNLVDNAVKYGARKVGVRVARERDRVLVTVVDDGSGIAGDLLPHLFKPFVQAAQPLARPQGGLGLGLALVDRLAELHGGTVEAASEGPGRGSTFTLRLPAMGPGPAAVELPRGAARAKRKRRVLVVEDERDARESLCMLLEMEGHEVASAADGVEGLAKLERLRPEVAVVDIGLPGIDGYELARRARSLPGGGDIRLVALTGYGRGDDRSQARQAGFDLHLTKPITYQKLEAAFERSDWPEIP